MALNEEVEFEAINARTDHVIDVWNDMTIVWGGLIMKISPYPFCDPKVVYCHLDGAWMKKVTQGDIPPPTAGAAAGIIGDELFVACGKRGSLEENRTEFKLNEVTNTIYKLDLNEWRWSKLEPGGAKPPKSWRMASWVSGEKLFLFGGVGLGWFRQATLSTTNNQLAIYDSATNQWHLPLTHGMVPSPRLGHAAFVFNDSKSNCSRSYAFVFGGEDRTGQLSNKLFTLDLSNLIWEEVLPPVDAGAWPEARCKHTLTRISDKFAVLYGGKKNIQVNPSDCWMLNIEASISQSNPESIWTRCTHHENEKRVFHAAAVEPSSKRLWIVGGYENMREYNPAKYTTPIRELTFSSDQRLRVLALESVARNKDKYQETIKTLPEDLQRAIINKAENHVVT